MSAGRSQRRRANRRKTCWVCSAPPTRLYQNLALCTGCYMVYTSGVPGPVPLSSFFS